LLSELVQVVRLKSMFLLDWEWSSSFFELGAALVDEAPLVFDLLFNFFLLFSVDVSALLGGLKQQNCEVCVGMNKLFKSAFMIEQVVYSRAWICDLLVQVDCNKLRDIACCKDM
jgi:hypothetical protein